jgi:excisionase family DNA binding protein
VNRLLSPEEAAEALGCHRSFVFALLARRELGSLKLGRLRRIPVSEVERLIAARLAAGKDSQPIGSGDVRRHHHTPQE